MQCEVYCTVSLSLQGADVIVFSMWSSTAVEVTNNYQPKSTGGEHLLNHILTVLYSSLQHRIRGDLLR